MKRQSLMIPSPCEGRGMDQISGYWGTFPAVKLRTLLLKDAHGLENFYPKSYLHTSSMGTPGPHQTHGISIYTLAPIPRLQQAPHCSFSAGYPLMLDILSPFTLQPLDALEHNRFWVPRPEAASSPLLSSRRASPLPACGAGCLMPASRLPRSVRSSGNIWSCLRLAQRPQ